MGEICADSIPCLWEQSPFVQMFSEQEFLICCQLWEMSTEMSDEMKKIASLWQHFFNIRLIGKSFYQRWNYWRESVNRQDFIMVN